MLELEIWKLAAPACDHHHGDAVVPEDVMASVAAGGVGRCRTPRFKPWTCLETDDLEFIS